jgi:hypothetical protein
VGGRRKGRSSKRTPSGLDDRLRRSALDYLKKNPMSGMDDGEEQDGDARENQDEARRNPQQSEISIHSCLRSSEKG